MFISKKIIASAVLGMVFGLGVLGAQYQEINSFLNDYLKVTQNFSTAMEKASTAQAVKKAVADFSAGMKPLAIRAEQLERKYKNWGPALLLNDPQLEKEWEVKMEQTITRLSNALMKVYQLAAEDPSLMEALESMGDDMEKIWPADEIDDEE